jgi:purine-binding chemotaxis protein CheW
MTPMTKTSKSTSSSIELLSFSVCGEDYSVDIMSVREIRGGTTATALPHAPDFVRGVINLRGNVLPILDLAVRLGLPRRISDADRHVIIVVDVGGRMVGLMVDAVSDILTAAAEDLQPPPEVGSGGGGASHVNALFVMNDRLYRVLDLGSVLPAIALDAA